MEFKPVPDPPGSIDTLREARNAIPLVPGDTDDCCARIRERIDTPDRETARDWLTFLRALGVVERGSAGYTRTRAEVERDALAAAFRDRVYGVESVLGALDGTPRGVEDVFERCRGQVPAWERQRDPEWERTWRERTERVLEWGVLFGIVVAGEDGYRIG